MRTSLQPLAAGILVLAACAGEAAPHPPAQTGVALSCACDKVEDCDGCFRHVGTCCYEDERMGGQVLAVSARCQEDPACQVCCTECTKLSCDELIRRQLCPPIAPP